MNSIPSTSDGLGLRVFEFLQFLREHGYLIGVRETTDIINVATASTHPQPTLLKTGMRALCCRSSDEWEQFDHHYNTFWHPHNIPASQQDISKQMDTRHRQTSASGIAGASSQDSEHGQHDLPVDGAGAGRNRSVGKADFRFLSDKAAMREAERMAELLGKQLRKQLSRRRVSSLRGGQLDIRKTLRRSVSTGGLPAHILFSQRKPIPPHLVIFQDVSHSMTWNNPLLFRFVRGLVQAFPDASAYAFHTRLFPVTHMFRESSLKRTQSRLEAGNQLWMGGTCIATSLHTFNQFFSRRDMKPKSTVLIMSDGFDTDDRESLESELETLRKKSKKLIWLNPMLGRPGVTLDANNLKQEFPMVDKFMPANSVDALRSTIREIGRG